MPMVILILLLVLGATDLALAAYFRRQGKETAARALGLFGLVTMSAALAFAFMNVRDTANDHRAPAAQTAP